MFYCEDCLWEGEKLKLCTNLSQGTEVKYYECCPKCRSDNISIFRNSKEGIITTIKRHIKGIEKAIEKLEKE